MSSKKVFNINDKVFAKRKYYPAWPAIISSVNTNSLSQTTYNVYLYGTGNYIECEAEFLFPYEENKSKLKRISRKNRQYKSFVKALFEIENATDIFFLSENDVHSSSIPSSTKQIFHQEKFLNESKYVDRKQLIDENHLENKNKLKINVSSKFKDNEDLISKNNVHFTAPKIPKIIISNGKIVKCIKKPKINKPSKLKSLKINETQLNLYEENKFKVRKLIEPNFLTKPLTLTQVENGTDASVLSQESSNTEQRSNFDKSENVYKINKISDGNSVIEGMLKVNESSSLKNNTLVSTPKKRKKRKSSVKVKKRFKKSIENVSRDVKCSKKNKSNIESNEITVQSLKNRSINIHNFQLNEIQPIVLIEVLNHELLAKFTNEKQNTKSDSNVGVDHSIHETSDKNAETINVTKSTIESSDALLDSSKTVKLSFNDSDFNSLSNETSTTSHLKVSCSGGSFKEKEKEHSASKNKNDDIILEQNCTTKGTSLNSETENTLKSPIPSLHLNSNVSEEVHQISNKISNLPSSLKDILTDFLSNVETKFKEQELDVKKIAQINLLQVEVDTLDYIYKLRSALSIDHFDCEMALQSLEQISKLEINALVLIKNPAIIDTIIKVTKYVGNASEWKLSEEETIKHYEQAFKVRHKAQILHKKCVLLFTNKCNAAKFNEIYDKKVREFKKKTRHLARNQIYECTSIKL